METKQSQFNHQIACGGGIRPKSPLQIVEIDVEMPRKGRVLFVTLILVCAILMRLRYQEAIPEGVFPVVLGHEGAGVVVAVGERCVKA